MARTLVERLHALLQTDYLPATNADASPFKLADARPLDRRDRLLSLLAIYDLHTTSLQQLGSRVRWAGHPAIAPVKYRLEQEWIAELDQASQPLIAAGDPVTAIRSLAAKDRLPPVYRWVAKQASLDEVRHFLAVEGGPDGGFDDLVAVCQVGLSGASKMEMARNYWDEMGNGVPGRVHTDLHRQMADAIELPHLEREAMPGEALSRSALGGLLTTNRWLQPEMVGALGLIELQAGPRCRLVLEAFRRHGVAREAETFYAVHADVDPRHGKDWLEQVIAPLAAENPGWGARMIRGAAWRWVVNAELFDALAQEQIPAAA
jgi:hypothetical protein